MAFVPGSIANQVAQPKAKTGGFVPGSIASTVIAPRASSGFVPGSISGSYGGKADTKSANGLYQLAVKNGLKDRADSILRAQQGEQTNRIFSGGFISDALDVLNALQYGVVGVLKGKKFVEGVRDRSSFSDKDALGDKGLPGVIAGIALDIAFDPLTYIAPASVLKRVPFLAKIARAAKTSLIGQKVLRGVDTGKTFVNAEEALKAGERTFETLEGGTKAGRYLTEKLAYRLGKDPVFLASSERATKNAAVTTQKVVNLGKTVANISPDVAAKIVKVVDDQGRLGRESLKVLSKVLKPDEFVAVSKLYKTIDDLGQEAVDLGLISKKKFEENYGEYLKNAYTEFEQKTGEKMPFGWAKTGIKGIKSRADKLSEARKIDRIENPAYLLMKSAIDLTRDVENAKLFREVAKKFGTDVAQPGFTQIKKTSRFVTSSGAQAGIKANIAEINKKLGPLLTELKMTFKADKKALGEILGIEKLLKELGIKRGDELYKFFAEGDVVTKVSKVGAKIRGWSKLPETLQPIGKALTKYKTLDEVLSSPLGIKLEKLYEDGVLERAGFKDAIFKKGDKEITVSGMKAFFNFVKKPYKAAKTSKNTTALIGDMDKIIALQKQIEKYTAKAEKLSDIDKKSINDSFINLEKNISDLRFAKEDLQQSLEEARLGDLAGKYVPDHMAQYLQEIIEPSADTFGKWLMGNFKFAKVVMNPGTHARNIASNEILNYWKLGMNPLDPRTIMAKKDALTEIARGGGKWTDEARPLGYNLDTFASAELKGILDAPEFQTAMGKAGSKWKKVKNKLGDLYQAEENQAKLTAYIYQRRVAKLGPEEAWKAAESATFNYAQVTPFIRKLRTSLWGMPFITFTYKATPLAIETMLKHPNRISVIGKIKKGIENLSDLEETDRERASEPAWVRDGFYIKLPGKDEYGRSKYFDLTYILPFGDLVSGGLIERGMKTETGTKESTGEALLRKNPVTQLIMELGKNRNFYGNKIWKDSDPGFKQTTDIFNHILKTYSPPPLAEQLPNGYDVKTGERDWRGFAGATEADETNQKRDLIQEVFRNFGVKIQPIDADIQETYQEWNNKKALETLLKESGVLKGLEINYVPKDE